MDHSYPAEIERLMERKGYMKQRGTGVSIDALATAAGIHVDTVKTILQGGRSNRPKSVAAVAKALGVSSSKLSQLSGRGGGEVYVGPDATRRMSERQRAALTEFLLATMDERQVGSDEQRTAPNTQAPGSGATAEDAPKRPDYVFGSGRVVHTGEDDEDDHDLAASEGAENIPRRQDDGDS